MSRLALDAVGVWFSFWFIANFRFSFC